MSDELVEALRWVNVALSGIGLIWLILRMIARWSWFPYEYRLFYLTLTFYVFGVFEGTVENIYDDNPQYLRVLVLLMSNVALISTLALTQKVRRIVADREVTTNGH